MTLHILTGRAGAGKTSYCLDAVTTRMNTAADAAPILLLVPEQATFQIERQLAARTSQGGFVQAHVSGFRRLAQRVLTETGGASRPQLTDLGKRLALRRLLVKHRQELQILGRAARQRTFAETLVSAIWEFKTWLIAPEQLDQLHEQLGETVLAAKMHDLALLYRRFEEFLAGRYHDPEDALTLLAQSLNQSELIRGAHVYIDGFHWFTPQEYQVIEALLKTAADVTVTLCFDERDQEAQQNEVALFHRQWNTWQELSRRAKRLGMAVTSDSLKPGGRFVQAPLLAFLEERFFDPAGCCYDGDCSALLAAEAANRRVEAEGIARRMIALCRDGDYRWRDMAVLVRDSGSYSELMETVLTDYDIPFFSDRRRPVVHHPLAELIRSSLEVITDNWTYDPVFRCLKTDLFPLGRGDIDILENYCLEFGIRGSRWTEDKPWTFVRRLSLDEDGEINEREQQRLNHINSLRNLARQPLVQFQQTVKSVNTVSAYTAAVYQLLMDLDVPGRLDKWAAKAEEAGDLDQSREHRQLWAGVIDLFDQLAETCGDEAMALDEYAEVLGEGLEGLALSLIPPSLDYVTVSTLERGRTLSARAVFLPGVNEGVLPQRSREEGLLTDTERQQLAECGMELAPGSLPDAFHEQFAVYTALTRASEQLWLSYSLADEEGKALAPSLVFDRLKRLRALRQWQSLPVDIPPGCEEDYLVHARRALSALAAGLREVPAEGEAASVWWQVYNWAHAKPELRSELERIAAGLFHTNQVEPLPTEVARELYVRNNKLRGSVTRFEGYRACPFQYFSRYGLNLRPRSVFKLAAPDFGQFLHAILKTFGEQLQAEGRQWHEVTSQEADERCRTITEELAPRLQNEILLSSRHYQHIKARLERTAGKSLERLTRFAGVSSFRPAALEQSFGRDAASWPALVFPIGEDLAVELAGQIDRLDKAEQDGRTYLLIVDYKSGQAGLKLSDVVHGLKLQLITYLLAACQAEGEQGMPAGVLYYYLKNPRVTNKRMLSDEEIAHEIGKQLKMPGWVLAEPTVVKLVDNGIDGWSDYVKLYFKNEKFHGSNKAVLKTAEQFQLLMAHAQQIIAETAQEIISGQAAIAPYNSKNRTPCGFCDYRPVCQFDSLLSDNQYRVLPDLSDDEAWQQLAAAKGGENE